MGMGTPFHESGCFFHQNRVSLSVFGLTLSKGLNCNDIVPDLEKAFCFI